MEFYHCLSNMTLQITGWHIRVKVLRSFRINVVGAANKHLGLILSNEAGVRIEAMVDTPFASYYDEFISEGEWLTITKFGVLVNLGEVKATKHLHKIYFLRDTVVKKVTYTPVSGNIDNNFSSFTSIARDSSDTTYLVDLVGAISDVGRVQNTSDNKQDIAGFVLPFKIKDKDENVLEGMAVSKEALDFERTFRTCGGGVVIVALRWWKVIRHPERPSNPIISTNGGISKVDVNPNIPEVEDIREMIARTAMVLVKQARSSS